MSSRTVVVNDLLKVSVSGFATGAAAAFYAAGAAFFAGATVFVVAMGLLSWSTGTIAGFRAP